MIFKDRVEAGKKLAKKLLRFKRQNVIVLALPRGGVLVGYQIAKQLNAPLDVLVVRKLGSPANVEFGVGAVAPGGVKILDETVIENLGLSQNEIDYIERQERAEMNRRIKKYRGIYKMPDLKNRTVILVDDGLATGVTARAAIKSILRQHPQKLVVALPVCALDAVEGLRSLVRPMKDEVICLAVPYDFPAVGYWYEDFHQVSDEEVVDLLHKAKKPESDMNGDLFLVKF